MVTVSKNVLKHFIFYQIRMHLFRALRATDCIQLGNCILYLQQLVLKEQQFKLRNSFCLLVRNNQTANPYCPLCAIFPNDAFQIIYS